MYLKQLDIIGFKSFANKTNIRFSRGMTAIVGPNGCGKTNILDALRWVLGEQRISLLRGSKMEEVIFNGTTDVKPLGMADVTLTLVNNRGVLPTEYNEIQITRRLFRSGESEYFLNKVPCRLKDITELFFDTGVGAHSYSVIQQDMIEAVISDKAEERRFLFEEAAGITKYKQRKKAALRKLEATEQDLLRLKDIYAEVQTQVRSLKRQYKKAERYRSLLDDVRQWELYLAWQRLTIIDREKREVKSQHDARTDRIIEKDAQLETVTAQLEAHRRRQIELEQNLSKVNNEVYELNETAHRFEKEVSVLTEKRAHARDLCERNEKEIAGLRERTTILREQKQETEQELQSLRSELEQLTVQLTEAEEKQAEVDRRLLDVRTAKEREGQQLLELEGKLSSGKTEESNLKQQESEVAELIADLDRRIAENSATRDTERAELQDKRTALAVLIDEKSTAEKLQAELRDKIESLVEQSEELKNESANVSASIEACEARRHLLEDMMLQYEGYESGVVATMEERGRWPGILGTVAEKFVPVAGMEIATEAALGEMGGFLICQDRSTAENIIRHLRKENKGKIGILVPDSGTLNPVVKRPELNTPEFVGWLDDYVKTDDSLRPLMAAVLSRTAVFEADQDPTCILELLPFGFKAVSTTGMVYGKNTISGGATDMFPLFRRKEKVAEQEEMIKGLSEQLASLKNRTAAVTAEIAETRARSHQVADKMESLSEDMQDLQKKVQDCEYRLQTTATEINRLTRERSAAHDKRENIRHRQLSLGLDYNKLHDRKQHLTSSMSQISEQLNEYETAVSKSVERVSRLQVQVVETRSRVEQTESKLNHTDQLLTEIARTIENNSKEIEQAQADIASSTDKMAIYEKELKQAFEKREAITGNQSRLETDRGELLTLISSAESELKKYRTERDTLNNDRHQLDMKLTTLTSDMGSLVDRMRDEYEVNLQSAEIANPDESLSPEKARAHLVAQKEQLKKYGAVNLLALDEYKTASEREKFLGEQIEDLSNARNDLRTTITRINHTARELFLETFDKVRQNFKKLFVELFTGGEADISLVDPTNPLESDINIIARPRGKKLLSITMMSGGERALTAISLLFSLYLVKPSPFCILDEIDAPLDDANCRRFLKIIESFSNNTQFVIITHNKITMEAADNLYGVTMDQPGISQMVAVRFTSDDDDNTVVAVGPEEVDRMPIPESGADHTEATVTSATETDSPQNS